MKINKFLITGVAIAAMSLSVHAQEAPNNQQEINPTVAKTLNTVGGFFGSLVQGAKNVAITTADGVKTMSNSEGAQNIKNGVMKGARVVSDTATDVANSDIGQSVKQGAVKSANFVSTTAKEGVKAVSSGYKDVSNQNNEPVVEAASISPVTQPATTPTLSEGVATAKNKIGGMINFLREKATSNNNTNDNDGPKVKP